MKAYSRLPAFAALAFCLSYSNQALAWDSSCKDGKCSSSVVASQASNGKPLLKVVALFDQDGKNPSLLLITPLGTSLDAGARFKMGDQEVKLLYKVCYPDGCQAFAKLESGQWDLLKTAKTAQAQFFEMNSGKLLGADIDLAGLGEAVTKATAK